MQTGQTSHKLETQIVKAVSVRYLLHLPSGCGKGRKRWPMILFLHGAGERGNNLRRVKRHGLPKLIQQGKDLPFIVVSPQCPEGQWWSADVLDALLDEMVAGYPVDEGRIYLTGLSMGGYGTWMLATERPGRFAAAVPICGGGEPFAAHRLTSLPIWAFHGAKDPVVPVGKSREMVAAIKRAGGRKIRLTVYADAEHDSWSEAYDDPRLYEWLLKQKRRPASKARTQATR